MSFIESVYYVTMSNSKSVYYVTLSFLLVTLSNDHFAHDLRHLGFSAVGSLLHFLMADFHWWFKAAQVSDDAHAEDLDAAVARHDHLRNGRHAYRVTTQEMVHPILGRRLEGRTLHADVDTVLQGDALLLSDTVSESDQLMVVSLVHIGKARTCREVLTTQGMLRKEIDMVGDDHHVADVELRVHATGGVADEEHLDTQLIHHTLGEGNFLHRVALVEMEAAVHGDDVNATELSEDEFSGMSLHGRHGEVGNVLVRNFQCLSYLGS